MIQSMIASLGQIAQTDRQMVFLIVDDIEVYEGLSAYVPDRTFVLGIAECNALNVAAGLANSGYKPYVIGGNAFLAYRGFEFIRSQICLESRNVKMIGIGAGMAIGVHGSMHTATEDVAILRALPNLTVVTPATPSEVTHILKSVYEMDRPAFIRLGRSCGEDFFKASERDENIQEIIHGSELLILGHGSIVCDALCAVQELEDARIGAASISVVKPMDTNALCELAKRYKKWLTIEEHNIHGGFGSAVAEVVVDHELDVRLKRMGLSDVFARTAGAHADMKRAVGLGVEDIKEACRHLLEDNC